MPERNLTVLVPSRNRPEMALAAVRSLLAQGLAEVSIVVSDNSTDERAREELAAGCAAFDGVAYMRPPSDLAMTDHWNWAFSELNERFPAPFVTMLTDRMVMRQSSLAGLLELAKTHPGRVISYNHDAVDDTSTPVRLRLEDRSGRTLELSVEHLLERCSHMYFHPCIPRVMNCIVPRTVLEAVAERFGSLFASISPDHCFGFRCLDVVERIIYHDACPLIHYGLSSSNGATYARGVRSAAVEDFQSHLGGTQMNASAPVPGFHSITNAVVNEYCFVRDEAASRKLPPVDWTRYLGVMARETSQLEDPQLREQMRALLDEHGWQGKRLRYRILRARDAGGLLVRYPRPFLRMLRLALAARAPARMARAFGDEERRMTFPSAELALAHLMQDEASGAYVHVHLLPLILPPGAGLDVGRTRI
ncbi:MAG TPA: glycosyltransferase [Solirubrobacteraceae bacterium]